MTLNDASGHVLGTTRSATGTASFISSVPSAGTYSVAITDNFADIGVPSFNLDTTLPKNHPAAASLALKDASGHTLATASGPSPLSITQTVVAGVYNLVVSAVSGTVNTLLTGSYPGRPPKEVIGYDANDHATSIDDGTTTTKETLAPSGRVLHRVVTDDMLGTVSDDTIFGYDGSGDSPAYTRSGLLGLSVTTYVSGPGGLLAIDAGATASYPISNLHGDTVGITDGFGTFTSNPVVDEFGVGTTTSNRLGYLGNSERFSTGGNLDLIRMGSRLYDSSLARFLETDPVEGGCSNAYAYVHGDPINASDPTGSAECNGLAGESRNTYFRVYRVPDTTKTPVGAITYEIFFDVRMFNWGKVERAVVDVYGANVRGRNHRRGRIAQGDTNNHQYEAIKGAHTLFYPIPGDDVYITGTITFFPGTVDRRTYLGGLFESFTHSSSIHIHCTA